MKRRVRLLVRGSRPWLVWLALANCLWWVGFGPGTASLRHTAAATAPPRFVRAGLPQSPVSDSSRGSGQQLATTRFDLVGLNLKAGPVTQSVPKNTPTVVTTMLEVPPGSDPQTILANLNPNYRIRGELVGPSVGSPRSLEAKPGEPLPIPALSKTGDHRVQNLRVVDLGTGGLAVAPVTPDVCGITVIEQLLVSEVKVRELDYDEIVKSGIQLTDANYKFFNFTLGLGTESVAQQISLPVAFPSVQVPDPRPLVGTPTLPEEGLKVPAPEVLPVMLKVSGGQGDDEVFNNGLGPEGAFPGRIPGLIVFPGRVGFLNQFFEAIVIVANGAPDGTPLVVKQLKAKVRLPDNGTPNDTSDDPLRIAVTQTGGAVTELELHGLGGDAAYGTTDDTTAFAPGQSGQGTFLLEGLREGLHNVTFELEGKLDGLPAGTVTVSGEVSGAVLVRDASFAVTFTHPRTVRAGQEYTLAMTLLNNGGRDIQGAVSRLNPNSIVGAELLANDNGERAFQTTIRKGASATVSWRLRSQTTGQVTASYVKVGQDVAAGLTLTTGVGDRNVPLSPDSLVLPDETRFLPPEVVDAARAVLGQAWSVATTPKYQLPQDVVPLERQVVADRAVELGVAGVRVEFGEPVEVSLTTLLRDWLGELQSPPDAGFADVLRNTFAGYTLDDRLGEQFRRVLTTGTAPVPEAFHRSLIEAESPRSPFVSVLVSQADGPLLVGARLVAPDGKQVGFGATAAERFGDLRQGVALALSPFHPDTPPTSGVGQYLLVSQPAADSWTLELTGRAAGTMTLSLALPTTGSAVRLVSFPNFAVAAGDRFRIVFNPYGTNPVTLEKQNGMLFQAVAVGTVTAIAEPPPRIVGAVQLTAQELNGGDDFGRLVGILYSKPMNPSATADLSRYLIGGGELLGSNPVQMVGRPLGVGGVALNFNDRLAILKLNGPIGPYLRRDVTVQGVADAAGAILPTAPQTVPIRITVSPQGTPPGGYVVGRVLSADGTPVANALVQYTTFECDPLLGGAEPVLVALFRTDAEGRYAFDYVRASECQKPPVFEAIHPVTNSTKRLSTALVYDGQRLGLDFVFLARGMVQGTVLVGGQPAPSAFVRIMPTLDVTGTKVVQADAAGFYSASDIPVGPVSLQAIGFGPAPQPSGVAAGYIESATQTAVVNVNLAALNGNVSGSVRNVNGTPVPGALVIVYSAPSEPRSALGYAYADSTGVFSISRLPLQTVWVETTDYVTRVTVKQPAPLSVSQSEITGVILTLQGFGDVTGRVLDENNQPVAGIYVQGTGRDDVSDADGFYRLRMLPAGRQEIRTVFSQNYQDTSLVVQVAADQTVTNANLFIRSIPVPGVIQGTVTEFDRVSGTTHPVAGVVVTYDGIHPITIDDQGRKQYLSARTNAQGFYRLTEVPATVGHTLRFVKTDTRLAINLNVEVPPGATVTRDVTFRPAYIRGRVLQPDGVTGAVAEVQVKTTGFDSRTGPQFGLLDYENTGSIVTHSASDGTFALGPFNPGPYRVRTSSGFFPVTVGASGTMQPDEEVTLTLTLVNQLAGKIEGRVFQPDGVTPVGSGMRVTLSGGPLADAPVRTDATGHYEFPEVFSEGAYSLTATDPVTGWTARQRITARFNQGATYDIRLLGTGSLRVRVVDGAGNPVPNGTLRVNGAEYPNTSRFGLVEPGTNPVQFDNLAEGTYSVAAMAGLLGGRGTALVVPGQTVEVTVPVQNAGTVKGTVFLPGGQTRVDLADVKLALGGHIIGFTLTTDVEPTVGEFQFESVPAGDFTIDVFDNRSGRTGRATGRIVQQGETAVVTVELIPIGTVLGQVTANGLPVTNALVRIQARGAVGFNELVTTADSEGRYRFAGIPAGAFQVSVSNGPGGLAGYTNGSVPGGAEPLLETTANIVLQASATLAGRVLREGSSDPLPGARITIDVGGRRVIVNANDQGGYRVDWLPLGSATVLAEAPTGFNRGRTTATLATGGEVVTADVTLDGTGTVQGVARESNGVPLGGGTVTLTTTGDRPQLTFTATVQPDGSFALAGMPVGTISLKLTVPNVVRVGSALATVPPGGVAQVDIQLADSGSVAGRVKKPDGFSNAASAKVTLRVASGPGAGVVFTAYTDFDGRFDFPGVPVGSFTLLVEDAFTQGLATYPETPLANQQTLDVGTLVLDVTPIAVASIVPSDGAVNVSRMDALLVTFSEPARRSQVNSNTLRLLRGTGSITSLVSLSLDGRVASVTPVAALDPLAAYTLVVTTQVTDEAGLPLTQEVRSSFTTRDDVPPTVTAVNPLNTAIQVPRTTTIQASFNEALDANQDFATVLQVTPSGGSALGGSYALDGTGKVLIFTPAAALAESTRYTVTVAGAKDLAGNIQAGIVTTSFLTVDTTPPVVTSLQPVTGARVVTTARPLILATYTDDATGINPAAVVVTLDGTTVNASVGTTQLFYVPPAPLAVTVAHTVTVRVTDNAGNQSVVVTTTFTLDDAPPTVDSFTIGGAPATDGMTVGTRRPLIQAGFSDEGSLTSELRLAPQGQTLALVATGFATVGYQPDVNLAEGAYTVQLRSTDAVGNQRTVTVNFTIQLGGPQVTAVSPADGATDVPRTSVVTITFNQPVQSASITAETVRLFGASLLLPTDRTLAPDRTTVTLTPVNPLPNFTQHRVEVLNGVLGDNGQPLDGFFSTTFTTVDTDPPVVSQVIPAANATGVALNSTVQVTFNEALDPTQAVTGLVRLTFSQTPNQPLAGNVSRSGDNRTLTFTPAQPLADSTDYLVQVTGQRDVNGNVQSAAFTSGFTTVDLTPPVVEPLPINGTVQETRTPQITANFSDNLSGVDRNQVVLTLDGSPVTPFVNPNASSLSYNPPNPLAVGGHTVTVQVTDQAGNQSTIRTASFTIDNIGPTVNSLTINDQDALAGIVEIQGDLRPTFNATYSDPGQINPNGVSLKLGLQGTTPQLVPATVTSFNLTYQPAVNLVNGVYTAVLTVTDGLGNVTVLEKTFTLDVQQPVIANVAPNRGSHYGGQIVTLTGLRLLSSASYPLPLVTVGGRPAFVKQAVAGSPDTVVIVIPPGLPGTAVIQVENDRGIGISSSGFTYEPDSGTPSVTEPDTVLLWHLDEPADGYGEAIDSGPTGLLNGNYYYSSLSVAGRFGTGRTGAYIYGTDDRGGLAFPNGSFTVEGWFRTGALDRTYTLWGKGDLSGDDAQTAYAVQLTATGNLRGQAFDGSGSLWQVETSGLNLTDDQWHQAALTLDRQSNRLALVVDGIEQAFTLAPAGFGALRPVFNPFFAGEADPADDTPNSTGPNEFPGVLDEIRVSSTAHPAAVIQQIYQGSTGTLGIQAVNLAPRFVVRNEPQSVRVLGYNLLNLTASATAPGGAAVPVTLTPVTANEISLQFQLDGSVPLGNLTVTLTSGLGNRSCTLPILDPARSQPLVEPDTLLFWSLDEAGDGSQTILDAGEWGLTSYAGSASTAQTGRFGGGRAETGITSSGPLPSLGTSDFTLEGWVKTGAVGTTALLFGAPSGYRLELFPDGRVRGTLLSTTGGTWMVQLAPSVYRVDDNQWHHVALVANRSLDRLTLVVDGVERDSQAAPPGFGALNPAGSFQAGFVGYNPWTGTLDAIRVAANPRSTERIRAEFDGVSPLRAALVTLDEINRDRTNNQDATTEVTVTGYNLAGVTAQLKRSGTVIGTAQVEVATNTYQQARLTVTLPPTVDLGAAQLVLSQSGQPEVAIPVTVTEHRLYGADGDTRLFWHLDETGPGNVTLQDAGPFNLTGTEDSNTSSLAAGGRFNGARKRLHARVSVFTDGHLAFGMGSFTLETWLKTSPVTGVIPLLQKEGGAFELDVLPGGGLRAIVRNQSNVTWTANLPGSLIRVDDRRWHYVAMVVDRSAGRLLLYVDGVERAAAPEPVGFGPEKGDYLDSDFYRSDFFAGFGGTLDELRISGGARTAADIFQTYFGPETQTGGTPVVLRTEPQVLQRGGLTALTLAGANLENAVVTGPTGITFSATTGSFSRLDTLVQVADTVARGLVTLTVTTPAGSTTCTLEVVTQAPFAETTAGTVLLWHLDETDAAQARLVDSGPFGIDGKLTTPNQPVTGRFGNGRRSTPVTAVSDPPALAFGTSGFTLETWCKTESLAETVSLLRKGTYDYQTAFAVQLGPDGLRGQVFDEAGLEWSVALPPAVAEVQDDQWHLLSLVADRSANRLKLYVDGTERAAADLPAGFGAVRVTADAFQAGSELLPGILDEIRVLNFARSAASIRESWAGADTPVNPNLTVTMVSPDYLVTNETTRLKVTGSNLAGLSAAAIDSGNGSLSVTVLSATASEAQLEVTVPAGTPPGNVQLALTSAAGSVTRTLRAVDLARSAPDREPDTLLWWRLEESGNDQVTVEDALPVGHDGQTYYYGSTSQPGRFGQGRANAQITAPYLGILAPGPTGFTLENWVRTQPVTTPALLAGVGTPSGYFSGSNNLLSGLELQPSGTLRGLVFDLAGNPWVVQVQPETYRTDDNQWHHLVLVSDPAANRLALFVDGLERAVSGKPAGFSAFPSDSYLATPFAGHQGNGGFAGTLDEIRFSTTPHSAARIRSDFDGTTGFTLGSFEAPDLTRNRAANQTAVTTFSVPGFGLENLTAKVVRNGAEFGATVTVGHTYRQADLTVSIPPATALGPADLVLSAPGFPDAAYQLNVVETATPTVEANTLLLWKLDASGNNSILIATDEGPLGADGFAYGPPQAASGRFGGARRSFSSALTLNQVPRELVFSNENFTLETWVQTGPVNAPVVLLAKTSSDGSPGFTDYALTLTAQGTIRGTAFSAGDLAWAAETAPNAVVLTDRRWHLVTMTLDRQDNRLRLSVDGVEQANAQAPAGFGAVQNVGTRLLAGAVQGISQKFNGALDSVRISAGARSASRIAEDFFGSDSPTAPPPTFVSASLPDSFLRGTTTPAVFRGTGLAGATVTAPAGITTTVTKTTEGRMELTVAVDNAVPIGPFTLTITGATGQTTLLEPAAVNPQPFANGEAEVPLLWHLDEFLYGQGTVAGTGAGPVLNGTTVPGSSLQTGRFGNGRYGTITADDDHGRLAFPTSSFTLEGWFRSGSNSGTYTLAGKGAFANDQNGMYEPMSYGLQYQEGHLRGQIRNATGNVIAVEMPFSQPLLNDLAWHYAALTVDRENGWVRLYVDGSQRAATALPPDFGPLAGTGTPFVAGVPDPSQNPQAFGFFPGVLDEIRVTGRARTPAEIQSAWRGQ